MRENNNFFTSTLSLISRWAQSRSLWYFSTGNGCCSNEFFNTNGARYDLERFGCLERVDPHQADLLVINGIVTKKAAPYLKSIFDQMPTPRYVLAVGSCACSGGVYSNQELVYAGAHQVLPVDVFIPGCPPRPEAIMNGLITLQEKVNGYKNIEQHS